LIGGTVGIYLALNDVGVISLVYQSIVQMAVAVIMFWYFSKWRPQFSFSLQAIKDIYQFGMHVTGTEVLGYVSRNIDLLLIGKFLGAEALGYYTLALKLMMVPIRNIAWMVSQVMYPAYSHIQHDVKKLRKHYLITLKAVCLVTFPMLFGLFVLAPEFVYSVLGPDWEPAILVIRLLCIVGILKVINLSWSSILLSRGRSNLHLWLTLIGMLTQVVFMMAGLPWGIYGVTALYAMHHILWVPISGSKALASIDLPIGKVFPVILRTIMLCLPMVLVVTSLKLAVEFEPLQALLVFTVSGAIIYALVLWYGEYRFILNNLPKKSVHKPSL
jgi:PST family polysaccharide transporter